MAMMANINDQKALTSAGTSTARLQRINADTTWLLTIPAADDYPTSTCNILIDPWLDPAEQVDFARSFSAQQRVTPALAPSVAALDEIVAREADEIGKVASSSGNDSRRVSRQIDAILLSHPFTDHAHPETLLDPSLPKRIALLVTSDAYKALPVPIKEAAQKGERLVRQLDEADPKQPPALVGLPSEPSLHSNAQSPLPSNVSILQTRPRPHMPAFLGGPPAMASQQLHGGVFLLWRDVAPSHECSPVHAILYTPHGAVRSSVPAWLAESPVQPCALLTSFDRIVLPRWISGTVNLGLSGALDLLTGSRAGEGDAQKHDETGRIFAARHLIDTHGEHKKKQGLVASLMRRYFLGKEDDEFRSDKGAHTSLQEKEANRRNEAQTIVDARSQNTQHIRVHCLGVGEILPLTQ